MNQLNSLCIVGIFTVAGFAIGYGGIIGWKRYVAPAIERQQWLREYKRQRALEYAAMMAVFASTSEETADAEMFFNHIQRDHGSIYGLKRAPNETPAQYTERILFAANDVRHFIPSISERTPNLEVD